MKYYKSIQGEYIISVSTENGDGDGNISEAEYNTILNRIRNKPKAADGYDYKLTADLEWELYELPPVPPEDEEATAEDYEAALTEVGV